MGEALPQEHGGELTCRSMEEGLTYRSMGLFGNLSMDKTHKGCCLKHPAQPGDISTVQSLLSKVIALLNLMRFG